MLKSLLYALAMKFAKYKVMDNFQTEIACYTLEGALSWLKYCSNQVVIYNTRTGDVIISRNQGA